VEGQLFKAETQLLPQHKTPQNTLRTESDPPHSRYGWVDQIRRDQIQNPGMPVQNFRQLPKPDAILVIRVLFEYTGLSIAGLSHAGSSWLFDVFGLHLKQTKAKRIL
jgi:hypothetical protein